MQALVLKGAGQTSLLDHPKPIVQADTDAVVHVIKKTVWSTDLQIPKGDVAICQPRTILGHEGVGVLDSFGPAVVTFNAGDRVLISCITARGRGRCPACRKRFGATAMVNSDSVNAAQQEMKLTEGFGVDTAFEGVSISATFDLCDDIVALKVISAA